MSGRAGAIAVVGVLVWACGSSSTGGGAAGSGAAGSGSAPASGGAHAGMTAASGGGRAGASASMAGSGGAIAGSSSTIGGAGGLDEGFAAAAGMTDAGSAGVEPAACGDLASGAVATRIRYQGEHAPYGSTCASEQQTATCQRGVLGAWTGSYVFEACSPFPPADCGAVAHAASATRTRFAAASVAYGTSCLSETQHALCDNGALGMWSGGYVFETCAAQAPAACGSTAHGASEQRLRYSTSSVPFGSTCAFETQTAVCSNGSFGTWSGSFTFAACSVGAAASCDGSPHGTVQERTRYSATSVPYGETCPKQLQTRSCNDGVWTTWTGSTSAYVHETCETALPADCGGTAHGGVESRLRYKDGSVAFGSICVSEMQTRVCSNGTFSTWSGNYENYACSVQECTTGTLQTRSCGLNNRGQQTRPCLGGAWRPAWDNCVDPDVCTDGASGTPLSCNAGAGWKAQKCISGQWQGAGACGVCSGTLQDPCLENTSSTACFAAKYDGLSCGVWNLNFSPPRCQLQLNFSGSCSLVHAPTSCTPTFGCAWTEL